jgi:hypothetical protein
MEHHTVAVVLYIHIVGTPCTDERTPVAARDEQEEEYEQT